MKAIEFSDASLGALIRCWRRVLNLAPELMSWADRRQLIAWEAEAAWRRLDIRM